LRKKRLLEVRRHRRLGGCLRVTRGVLAAARWSDKRRRARARRDLTFRTVFQNSFP
jgi:hypothetical protein